MAKYMIHAYPKRMPYVEQFLVPSMTEQGINKEDIYVYNDTKARGNLGAFVDSLKWITKNCSGVDGVWHLQDDVIISHDFKEKTEQYDKGMVQGFKTEYDVDKILWYSFCCIRIPNKVIPKFLHWLNTDAVKEKKYRTMISYNKYDDALFQDWVYYHYRDATIQLSPNIVDHVDWLIGGSLVNKQRDKDIVRSVNWKDEYLVDELKEKLNART